MMIGDTFADMLSSCLFLKLGPLDNLSYCMTSQQQAEWYLYDVLSKPAGEQGEEIDAVV